MAVNHQIKLAARPVGLPKKSDWEFAQAPVGKPGEGEVLVKVLYISLDPYMRGAINAGKSYASPVNIGDVMRALAAGKVVASRHPMYQEGDLVQGGLGVQSYAVARGEHLTKIPPGPTPLAVYLGLLGMPGMTGYFGLLKIGQPIAGETVVVSGAAGAVGSVVGQIGKIKGCRVVGIAGRAEKCRYVVEKLGFDAAINYKTEDVGQSLQKHCPNGIDVYFDNVGGEILDTVLTQIRRYARIVICGAISQYNNLEPIQGPKNYLALLGNHGLMEGFIVTDYLAEYGTAMREMGSWMSEGRLISKEHVVEGIETFPETFLKLFSGDNFGKLIIKVSE